MAENGGRKGSVFMIWPPKSPSPYRILRNNNNIHRAILLHNLNKIAQYHNYVSLSTGRPKVSPAKAKHYTAKFAATGLDQA